MPFSSKVLFSFKRSKSSSKTNETNETIDPPLLSKHNSLSLFHFPWYSLPQPAKLCSLPSCFSLLPQATTRSTMHHSGKMSSSTTAMASHAPCRTSMQLVFLQKEVSPTLKKKWKKTHSPEWSQNKRKTICFFF